jgi:WD40 repeat protein
LGRGAPVYPRGKHLFSRSPRGVNPSTIRVWDATTGAEVGPGLTAEGRPWVAAALTTDGREVLTVQSGEDGRNLLRRLDAATGREVRRFTLTNSERPRASLVDTGHDFFEQRFAFTPDARMLATIESDSSVRLWDTGTGRETHHLRGNWQTIAAVFTPDGRSLLTAGTGPTVRVWDADSGRELRSFGGGQPANHLFLSPDGKWLASIRYVYLSNGALHSLATEDLRLWDLARGVELPPLADAPNTGACLTDAAFLRDGRFLAVVNADPLGKAVPVVRQWEIASGRHERDLTELWGAAGVDCRPRRIGSGVGHELRRHTVVGLAVPPRPLPGGGPPSRSDRSGLRPRRPHARHGQP